MSINEDSKRMTVAAAAASGLRWCKRGSHEARSEGSYYRDSNGQRCWQCDTCTAQWRQIQQQRRTGGHSMPPAAPNRDPAAIERVLQDQAEAVSQPIRGLADIARTVAQIKGNTMTGNTMTGGSKPVPEKEDPRIQSIGYAEPGDEPAKKPKASKKSPRKKSPRRVSSRIPVDSDVPPPEDALGRQGYPFGHLKVGDSFFVEKPSKGFTSMTNANNSHAPKVFTSRFHKGDDPKNPGKTGYRIWRIK